MSAKTRVIFEPDEPREETAREKLRLQSSLASATGSAQYRDENGNIYTSEQVVEKDVDTMGAQFLGWITKESAKSHCIDDWVRVLPVAPNDGAEARATKP